MILHKVTKYLFLDMAMDALFKNIINNFPFLIKHNIKVGSKLEKLLLIYNFDSHTDRSILAEMHDVEVIAIDGDIATFRYGSLRITRDGTVIELNKFDTIEIALSSLRYS